MEEMFSQERGGNLNIHKCRQNVDIYVDIFLPGVNGKKKNTRKSEPYAVLLLISF